MGSLTLLARPHAFAGVDWRMGADTGQGLFLPGFAGGREDSVASGPFRGRRGIAWSV